MMSKYGKNRTIAHKVQMSVSLMFLTHFDFPDLLLYRPTATWNLFVLYNQKAKISNSDVIYTYFLW